MFTLVAFHENIDLAGVEGNIAGLADQHMRVEGDQIFISEFNQIIGAHAILGTAATNARIVSPSLRRINPFHISPIDLGLVPAMGDDHVVFPNVAVPLEINEGIECLAIQNGGAAERITVGVWLADKSIDPVKGNIRRVRFTTALVLTVSTWSYGTINLQDELPVVTYKVVGGKLFKAGAVLFRFVPVGGKNRPGNCCAQAVTDILGDGLRSGTFGEWFSFSTLQPPGIEILDSVGAALATYEGFLDILV
jgi:hypothetical protein